MRRGFHQLLLWQVMWRANARLLDCSRSLMHTHNSKTRQLISSSLCHICTYVATASAAQPAGPQRHDGVSVHAAWPFVCLPQLFWFHVDFDSTKLLCGTPVPLGQLCMR